MPITQEQFNQALHAYQQEHNTDNQHKRIFRIGSEQFVMNDSGVTELVTVWLKTIYKKMMQKLSDEDKSLGAEKAEKTRQERYKKLRSEEIEDLKGKIKEARRNLALREFIMAKKFKAPIPFSIIPAKQDGPITTTAPFG